VGQFTGTGALAVGNGSTSNTLTVVQPSGTSTQSALTIASGATLNVGNNELILNTTSASALKIASTGTLNLNGEMIINYAPGQDPITAVQAYLTSGYNFGAWNGNATSGTGNITSTDAAANPTYALGYADYAQDPGFVAGLSSGQIEIKYTLIGDLNLDGFVNGSDFEELASNFGKADPNWDDGDMLYHDVVNGSDFEDLAANFGKRASGGSVTLSAADWAALDAFESGGGSAVPEPTSISLLVLGGAGLLARRRRRKAN
jgi:hypothetical protein